MTNDPAIVEPADVYDDTDWQDWQDEYDRKAEEYFAEHPKDDWSERDRDQW